MTNSSTIQKTSEMLTEEENTSTFIINSGQNHLYEGYSVRQVNQILTERLNGGNTINFATRDSDGNELLDSSNLYEISQYPEHQRIDFLDNVRNGENNLIVNESNQNLVNQLNNFTNFEDTNNTYYSIVLANIQNTRFMSLLNTISDDGQSFASDNLHRIMNTFLFGIASESNEPEDFTNINMNIFVRRTREIITQLSAVHDVSEISSVFNNYNNGNDVMYPRVSENQSTPENIHNNIPTPHVGGSVKTLESTLERDRGLRVRLATITANMLLSQAGIPIPASTFVNFLGHIATVLQNLEGLTIPEDEDEDERSLIKKTIRKFF